jgi:hypothetical protein
VAIFRRKTKDELKRERKKLGGKKKPETTTPVADFSYTSDALAQLIVDAWTDKAFEKRALDKRQAKAVLAERGVYLKRPHIITEETYRKGHTCKDPDEVVLVLPNKPRVGRPPAGHSLLETAKLLMAVTPNGI